MTTRTGREVLEKYRRIVRTFTAGEKTAPEFAQEYLDEFKEQEGGMPEETFRILQDLFSACDMYCEDPDLRREVNLDEEELLEAAAEAENRIEERLEREYGDG